MISSKKLLEQFILKATISVIEQKKPDDNEPIEYHTEEIMLNTLNQCATYFLSRKNLRDSEQQTLTTLQSNIHNKMDLTLIEENLLNNLANIKPIWGELFGTDRGQVYNTLIAFKDWSCFTWHARLYYKQQLQKKDRNLLLGFNQIITQQSQQLFSASQTILQHEKTSQSLTERATSQFMTIQQLRVEIASLKKELIENPHNTQTIKYTSPIILKNGF